jgi:hypothetical protein
VNPKKIPGDHADENFNQRQISCPNRNEPHRKRERHLLGSSSDQFTVLAVSLAKACNPTLYLLDGHEVNNSFTRNLRAQRCSKTKLDECELPWMMRICA